MKSILRRAGWAVLGAGLLCACGDSEEKEPGKITIGWMSKAAGNTFFDLCRTAAELAGDDLTAASGREVEVLIMDPEVVEADQAAAAQVAKIDEAIDTPVDALAISVVSPADVGPAIDRAVDAGIPVFTFDSDAPDSKRTTYYNMSNLEGAKLLAQLLGDLMDGAGKIAIMHTGQTSTSTTYIERMDGFMDEIEKNPDLEVVTTKYCAKEVEPCTDLLEEAMAEFPDIKGWYLSRGRVLREAEILTLAPTWSQAVKAGDVKVVGFDAPEDALHSVQKGLVQALISQDLFGFGYDVVTMAYDAVTAGREFDDFTDSSFDVVCSNNIDELVEMWEKKDFRSDLTECDLL